MEKLERPNNIHHQAFLCRDAEQTRWFYEDVMGFKLVAALDFESSPGFGEPLEYMHLFFEMGNGDHVAFFDIPDDADAPLSESEQALIKAACESVNHTSLGEFTYQNSVYLDLLVREHGVQLRSFPDDVVKAMAEASRDVRADSGRDGIEKRIYESFEAGLNKMTGWAAVSDGPYYAARALGRQSQG